MMVLTIDEVNDILDEVYNEFPEPLFEGLNGGVLLLEEEKPDLYVMGEYCWDEMGRYINIYYGSFAALLGDDPRQVWVDELRTTLRHELTHHVEGLAGERSLEYKDSAQLAQFQTENQAGQEDEDGV